MAFDMWRYSNAISGVIGACWKENRPTCRLNLKKILIAYCIFSGVTLFKQKYHKARLSYFETKYYNL